MRNGENPEPPRPPKEEPKNKDPHATNPHVGGNGSGEQEELSGYGDDDTTSSKKLLYVGIAALVLVLAIAAIWHFYSRNAVQPTPAVDNDTVVIEKDTTVVEDSVAVDTLINYTPTTNKAKTTTLHPITEELTRTPQKDIKKENFSYSGTLNLGYATWQGEIKNGKADGEGTMTFTSSHRIDTRDPSRRTAEAGDRVEGTYSNGHLVAGRWYKQSGETETLLIGE